MGILTATVQAKQWTYANYTNLPDDVRYELIEGELVVMDSPTPSHQEIVQAVLLAMHQFVVKYQLGKVFVAPLDVVLAERTVTQPDVMFVSHERQHIITDKNIAGAPDLVVEVASPSTQRKDRTRKYELYARYGVREYWIIDRDDFTVDVLHLAEGHYREVLTVAGEARSEILPGFVIMLRDLFA